MCYIFFILFPSLTREIDLSHYLKCCDLFSLSLSLSLSLSHTHTHTHTLACPQISMPLKMDFKIFKYVFQILNVYVSNYESGGQYWPIVHITTIFSLVLSQIIALGVFGIKRSPVASGFTIPLIIGTLLFNEYCRQRFLPVFKNDAAEVAIQNGLSLSLSLSSKLDGCIVFQVLIEMDRKDEQCGRMEETYGQLQSAYCQFKVISQELCRSVCLNHQGEGDSSLDPKTLRPGLIHPMLARLPLPGIKEIIGWLSLLFYFQERNQAS